MMTEPITMGYDLSGSRIGSSFTRPSIHPLALTSSLNVYGKFDQPKFTFLGTENKVRNTGWSSSSWIRINTELRWD